MKTIYAAAPDEDYDRAKYMKVSVLAKALDIRAELIAELVKAGKLAGVRYVGYQKNDPDRKFTWLLIERDSARKLAVQVGRPMHPGKGGDE